MFMFMCVSYKYLTVEIQMCMCLVSFCNHRFVVVCGDGEYIIYTAMALRNKSFGTAQEFVWSHDSSQ